MAPDTRDDLLRQNRELQERLNEAEEVLRALRNGEVDAVIATGVDGDRVYTLKGADEAYRVMVEGMAEGALTLTPDGLILFSNEQFATMVQTPLERVIGSPIQTFVAIEDSNVLSALLAEKKGRKAELRLRTDGAALIHVYASIDNLVLDGAECLCLMVTDLTEQKRGEEIVAAEKLARSILEQAAEAILVLETDGRITRASRAADALAGEAVIRRAFDDVFHINLTSGVAYPFQKILAEVTAAESINGIEATAVIADGSKRDLLLSAAKLSAGPGAELLGCIVTLTDITQRKRFQEQIQQSAKLESLGLLAGGIAHDFNNLLTGILGNISLAQDCVSPLHPAKMPLGHAAEASERAAHLTKQLLAYAGKGKFVIELLDLSTVVQEISALITTSIPKTVRLRLALADGLPAVEGDATQIQQLLMNLVINGAEAIPEDTGGTVLITTSRQAVDEEYIAQTFPAKDLVPGAYVTVEVHDTGTGIEPAMVARIFDPFFSTKFTGRGLGLAAVLGIVRGHKGALKVYSEPGKGSTFKVFFPATALSAVAAPATARRAQFAGVGTALVVDDELIVRQVAKSMLERFGYQVLLANNGAEAVALVREHRNLALVLLDLTMPVMGGEEALRAIKAIDPVVPVILSSGYNEVEAIQRFAGKGLAGFLQKPYTSARLADTLGSLRSG